MRNWHQKSYFTICVVFPGLGPNLTTGLKSRLTVHRIFLKNVFAYKLSIGKIKFDQAKSNRFDF